MTVLHVVPTPPTHGSRVVWRWLCPGCDRRWELGTTSRCLGCGARFSAPGCDALCFVEAADGTRSWFVENPKFCVEVKDVVLQRADEETKVDEVDEAERRARAEEDERAAEAIGRRLDEALAELEADKAEEEKRKGKRKNEEGDGEGGSDGEGAKKLRTA